MEETGSWGEYRKLLLSELERMNKAIEETNRKLDGFRRDEINQLQLDMAMLKVKSGIASAIVSVLVSIGVALILKGAGQ